MLLAALLAGRPAGTASGAQTEARLLLAQETARPGQTVTAAIALRMPPETHTYWRNPGESGLATAAQWTLPRGVTAGDLQWPVPERFDFGGIITYGYHGEVLLLVPLQLAADLPPGPLEIAARISWLECKELCVPGKTVVRATLTVGAAPKPSADAALIAAAEKKLPTDGSPLAATAQWETPPDGESRPLLLEWKPDVPMASADFFPYPGDGFDVAATNANLPAVAGLARLRLHLTRSGPNWPARIAGVLVEQPAGGGGPRAYEITPTVSGTVSAPAQPLAVQSGSRSLPGVLAFAFLAGLILNVMPCVLPVIALKVLSFVSQSKESPRRVRALGLVYGLGVLASFAALAALAVGVQKAGGLATWGMPLSNQVARVVMTVLITLVALNLFGLFEVTLSGRVMGAAGELAGREGYPGAFFNGILATVLATPCTAPFLGTALAFAFTQPPALTLLVFLTIGLGLAAPFVVLCWQPAWLKLLPKPGVWMERFKTAMGFPMLATAVWMFWFTAPEYGDGGVLWLGLFLVVVAAAAWIWGEFVQRGVRRRGLAGAVTLALLAFGYATLLEGQLDWRAKPKGLAASGSLQESADGIDWKPWSPEAVAQARADGRPVLVDFTAKNCLTCQLNKRTSLEVPGTREKLKAIRAVALLGDFSDEDPRIARELRRYDRPGVPLVLVYPRVAGQPPIVLPPLLTQGLVLDALEKAAE